MIRFREWLLMRMYGDPGADRIVPPAGFTSRLVTFATAAMAFLAVCAIALAGTTIRLGDSWQTQLAGTATLRITAPQPARETETTAALHVLHTTPGVRNARVIPDLEQQALLTPWFGRDLPLDALPLPRLIEITADDQPYDPRNLRLRLAAEAPSARLDDHDRWRAPLQQAETRMRRVIRLALILIATTAAAVTALAAQAALAANTPVISVLRLVGARDVWIARAFVRRITLRAFVGATAGAIAAALALLSFPSEGVAGLPAFGLRGTDWLLAALVSPFTALVAFITTRASALRTLKGLL